MKLVAKIIRNLINIAAILFVIWMVISFFNIVMNNGSADTIQNIWAWNFFKVYF